MADAVTLVLKANNQDYISKMKQAQTETQKVYDTAEKGGKREKGILEEIDATLTKLEKSKRKAFTYEDIEKYNKKIQETKLNLEEYEKAGIKANDGVKKSGDSMMQSVGKWALGFASVATAVNLLKDAFQATETGLRTFNVVGAITKQILYDMVSGNKVTLSSIMLSITANKELEKIRINQRKEIVEIAKAQTIYNELYFAASDQTKSQAEQLTILNQAMIQHEVLMKMKIASAEEELLGIRLGLVARPEETTLLNAEAQKLAEIETLKGEGFASTKRLESSKTGIIQSEIDKRKTASDKARQEEGAANKEYYLGARDNFFNYIDALNKKKDEFDKEKEEEWKFDLDIGKKNFAAIQKQGKEAWDLMIENEKKLKDAEKQVTDARKENFDKAGEAVLNYIAIVDELAQREVDNAQRKRELLDTQIDETQSALETEAELQKAGFASNVDAERVKLAALKVQRDKALKDEEVALKKAHTLKVAQLVAEQALAIAKVVIASEIAKAEARILIADPITAIPGIALLASIRVSEAISIAAITASIIAASLSKFEKGGMIGGRSHSQGGTVIEAEKGEFITNKRQTNKYRDVLEAINKDDKRMIFNSFNKLSPELLGGTTVNTVIVENEGPNKRLDQVTQELKQLNKTKSREEVYEFGNQRVIRKGNTTRIIKR